MALSEKLKAGINIQLWQLILAIIIGIGSLFTTYVKNQVEHAEFKKEFNDYKAAKDKEFEDYKRERAQDKSEAQVRSSQRNAQIDVLDARVDKLDLEMVEVQTKLQYIKK